MFDDLFRTSPKSMIMLGTTCFDLTKVQRFHYYDKKKMYYIYVRFEDGDEITIHYNSAELRDEAFKALRQAYCLYTDAEKAAAKAEMDAKKAEEAAKKKDEPRKTLFGTVYPNDTVNSLVSKLDVRSND